LYAEQVGTASVTWRETSSKVALPGDRNFTSKNAWVMGRLRVNMVEVDCQLCVPPLNTAKKVFVEVSGYINTSERE
jgi:hypothetical protein